MSSPLVTFNFKTFPKHRQTQFLNFLAQIWETGIWRQEVSIDFEKKKKKFDFFNFSWNKSNFFCLKFNSMWKMLSLDILHVEIAQKLQNLEISLIFSHFLMDFQYSPIFLVIFEKKNPKRGQMSWNWCQLLGKHDFWAKICSRAKLDAPRPGKACRTSVWLGLPLNQLKNKEI